VRDDAMRDGARDAMMLMRALRDVRKDIHFFFFFMR